MDGMGMLLKAAGFDPAQFQQFIKGMQACIQKMNADLDAIRADQAKIIALLEGAKNGE